MKLSQIDITKRLFALCIALVVLYIIIAYKHFNLSINLPKNIKISFLANSLNIDLSNLVNVSLPNYVENLINVKEKCDPVRKNYKQYYHDFDGIKYPQYLRLSQNYSIDFECMNNTSPMKRILVWNKFYGNF